MKAEILIVDDEADIRNLIKGILEDEGYAVRLADGAKSAYAQIDKKLPDLLVLDIWLQGSDHDGLEILTRVKSEYPFIPVVMISGHGTVETAVSAIKKGAYDFIEKPFKSDRLILMLDRALEASELRRENERLRQKTPPPARLIGESASIKSLRSTIEKVGPTNSRVLITGEQGAGKDLVAQLVHQSSSRSDGPLRVIGCAGLSPDKLVRELLGGDGLGISAGASGLGASVAQIAGGTLVLDEITDLPLETQAKLVRVLQEQRLSRGDGRAEAALDVRIMATSSADFESLIKEGRFREDLYYRINVVNLEVPPLREHAADIALLASYFFSLLSDKGQDFKFSDGAIRLMQAYSWPGNVRQLRNVIEWVLIMNTKLTDKHVFDEGALPPELNPEAAAKRGKQGANEPVLLSQTFIKLPLREARELFETEYLRAQISHFEGNISRTAKFIGMERSALHRKLKILDIPTSSFNGADAPSGNEKGHTDFANKHKRAQ